MNTVVTKTVEQAQIAETTTEQNAVTELQSVELAYIGGGMAIVCWG